MKYLITILLCASVNFILAQHTLSGKITDISNQKPLNGAEIYIAELNKGTVSKQDGNFEVKGLGNGNYNVKISFLGYQTVVEQISIENENITLNIELSPKPIAMNEVVISGAYNQPQQDYTYKIELVKKNSMNAKGARTIMDIIDNIPGVSAVTTGPLVSRPMIHGLQGNRIRSLVDGARFETQQWDDEHGVGINELGLERVEIIKGPSSLLYGPEAMGGVINFIEENPPLVGTTRREAEAAIFSNNLGGKASISYGKAKENYYWNVKGLGRLLSDYFYDLYDFRVPNTRLLEYGAKAELGTSKTWGGGKITYTYNKAYYGILDGKDIEKNEQGQIVNTDSLEKEKFPFEIEAPFHQVTDHRIHLKSTVLTGNSKIKTVLSYQNNHRAENEEKEGSKKGYRYLDMTLQSYTYDLKWYLPEWNHLATIVGSQGMHQVNKNISGAETVHIPDAAINDLGFLAVSSYKRSKLVLSAGIRYDNRNLSSEATSNPEGDMPAISRTYDNISFSLGSAFQILENLQLRANYASGYRSPNLNELFSNGYKLENQRMEYGNFDFKKETNQQLDINLNYSTDGFTLEGTAYWNSIEEYIYLAPTGENVQHPADASETIPVYEFRQSNANIVGQDFSLDVHPAVFHGSHMSSNLSALIGKRKDDDSYLPMMPATKWNNTVYLKLGNFNSFKEVFCNVGTESTFKQTQIAEDEIETPAYTILNASVSTDYKNTHLTLAANNILDKKYFNHLSRFRSYEIYEPGLNISLSMSFLF